MTRVSLTSTYSDLHSWPGQLLEATDGTVISTATATAFAFTQAAGADFAGFKVTVTGTGFKYISGTPTGGEMTKLVITDATNHVVMTFDTLIAGTLASDFAQFASNVFGSRTPTNDGPSPDGKVVLSHLLSGNDIIRGTSGDDNRELPGVNAGNDKFYMYGGDDRIGGSIGNDSIYGGDGYDRLTFRETTFNDGAAAFRGISVNTTTGKLTDCWGGTDTFVNVEEIEGSRFNDKFVGSAGRDSFIGLRGVDVFDGGADQDRVSYSDDYWQGGVFGIRVDLETSILNGKIYGSIRDGFGQYDKTIDIERVEGTRFGDVFVGSSVRNVFFGGEGKDSYDGSGGSSDFDVISFNNRFSDDAVQVGIIVDMALTNNQVINDGYGNSETAISIEEVRGSEQNDKIKMNSADNTIEGRDGRDTMTGGGGNDRFGWYNTFQFNDGDVITDFKAGGATTRDMLGFDHFAFEDMTEVLTLVNGTAATAAIGTFIFNSVNDTLYWDHDGTGADAKLAIVKLTGVDALFAANFDLFG